MLRTTMRRMQLLLAATTLTAMASTGFCWPMTWAGGPDGQGGAHFSEKVFNVSGKECFRENGKLRVQLVECTAPANILWPGDKAAFTFQIENLTDQPVSIKGKIDVIQYAFRTPGEDFFTVNFIKLADCGSVPFTAEIPAKGYKNIAFSSLPVPEKFGGYGIVVDCGAYGRLMGATTVRVVKSAQSETTKPFPRVMMEGTYIDVMSRLGAASNRTRPPMAFPGDARFAEAYAEFGKYMKQLQANHITTTIEFGGGPDWMQPMGVVRWFNFKDAQGKPLGVMDNAWLPKYDKDFQELVRRVTSDFGWPKGPIVGVKLYNEPWEGGGIDGWGADMLRYREMYTAMAQGVEQARKDAGVDVLIGGCDSTANTFDKLFATGPDDFLKWLDFTSMHYQGMNAPAGYKPWRNRKDANGKPAPVRMWDTESWVANSDERVAAVLSAYCSVGYDRVVGIFSDGFLTGVETIKLRTDKGTQQRFIKRPWSVCAALAAFSNMIGDRPFKELLFKNGLPWVMVFDGMPTKADPTNIEDGTVVVVGDLSMAFTANTLPFRTVKLKNAKMTIKADGDAFGLYDSYANPVETQGGTITLPLDGSGYYLRGNGKAGSFKKLLAAIESSRIEGIEPVEIKARDMIAPISEKPSLRISVTNVLNRPVSGTLTATLGNLTLDQAKQTLTLKANETRELAIPVSGSATADNSYALKASFDAGVDGKVTHDEVMHANVIARLTPTIDGKLDDWEKAIPQPVVLDGVVKPSTEELAWRPWEKFEAKTAKGFALGYLAYDDQYLYFASKVADTTPDAGMHRMENSNDDEWFYPQTCVDGKGKQHQWPEGVRRYTYAKQPELPSGNFPNRDNVQIGFNVLNDDEKAYLPYMPGTRPDYGFVPTNDYEYALNPIATQYGGGTEIWRLMVPGMAEKNFYPRQPKGPFDGPVKGGKLAITRDATARYVECAIPWSEIPHVRRALDNGKTIKFSFRVNDNAGGGCMEMSRNRSVAKRGVSFGVSWMEHWTNEVEFAFQK